MQDGPPKQLDALVAAQQLLCQDPVFWGDQLVTLQLPDSAVILDHGVVTHYFAGKVRTCPHHALVPQPC